jgi:hypothetical protein
VVWISPPSDEIADQAPEKAVTAVITVKCPVAKILLSTHHFLLSRVSTASALTPSQTSMTAMTLFCRPLAAVENTNRHLPKLPVTLGKKRLGRAIGQLPTDVAAAVRIPDLRRLLPGVHRCADRAARVLFLHAVVLPLPARLWHQVGHTAGRKRSNQKGWLLRAAGPVKFRPDEAPLSPRERFPLLRVPGPNGTESYGQT